MRAALTQANFSQHGSFVKWGSRRGWGVIPWVWQPREGELLPKELVHRGSSIVLWNMCFGTQCFGTWGLRQDNRQGSTEFLLNSRKRL